MRKSFLRLLCLVSILCITSCYTPSADDLPEISQPISPILQDQFKFSSSEREQLLTIYGDNWGFIYRFEGIPEWLSISEVEGEVNRGGVKELILEASPQAAGGIPSAEIEFDYCSSFYTSFEDAEDEEYGKLNTCIINVTMEDLWLPEVTISEAENITGTSFDIKGQVKQTGSRPVEEYGHCWSIKKDPELAVKCPQQEVCDTTKSFMSSIEDLCPTTSYYVWTYAKNDLGTSYSEPVIVTAILPDDYKWSGRKAELFTEGDGSETNPFVIKTGEQLSLMRDYCGYSYSGSNYYYFKLDNDIDLDNRNWEPILSFMGELDGNGHTISNLLIERDDDSNCGLIGMMYGSDSTSIKNLTIRGVNIKSNSCVGVMVGYLEDGSITNCKVIFDEDSELRGKKCVGGIVGYVGYKPYNPRGTNRNRYIEGCTVETTTSDGKYHILGTNNVGGIVGSGEEGNGYYDYVRVYINDCHVLDCNIMGTNNIGGLVGIISYGGIRNCEYQGTLDGAQCIGGICGEGNHIGITASKVIANIHCEADNAGGLSGSSVGDVVACYVDGTIIYDNRHAMSFYGMARSSNITFSYSTMQCDHSGFNPLGIEGAYSYSIYDDDIDKIKQIYEDSYDDKIDYWNFNNTWTWTGVVNGKQKSVVLPRLAWE